ncbi:MAG: DNA-directed DNA polymerase, partial [Nanoarchaeota archaeon]
KLKNGKVLVYLYGKLENGEQICVIHPHEPFFYAQVSEQDKETITKKLSSLSIENRPEPAKITHWEEVEKELLGKKQKLWKLYTNYPKAVPMLSRELQSWEIETYERDILFTHRYLRDMGIIPTTLTSAEGELQKGTDLRVPIFLAQKVQPLSLDSFPKPKILALDIETYAKNKIVDMEKNPILMLALYGADEKGKEFKKVLTWKRFSGAKEYVEFVSDEVELLKRFRQLFLEFRPDVLTGYFSDGFDLPYIKHRADKHKVKLDLGADYSELDTGGKANFREAESKITGLLHLDICKFVRNIFGKNLKTDSYTLDAVSEELLGHKKHVVNLDNLANVWDGDVENEESGKNILKELNDYCEYNLHDAHLTLELCQKLLPEMIEFTKIIGLPTNDVIRMRFSRLVENYILKRATGYNVLAPNKPEHGEVDQRLEETYQGAFVYEPLPGLYKEILVFDFRSLYPTIITAHNIGPESFRCTCCEKVEKGKVPTQEGYWFCTKEKKFIPTVLEHLILIRADLKKQIKEAKKEALGKKEKNETLKILEARSWAIKTLANSFYGYL